MTELRSIKYSRGSMEVLDQKKLPLVTHYDVTNTAEKAWDAIREMRIRGAPAIAICAALGLAVEVHNDMKSEDVKETADFLKTKLAYLSTSRPTAVNLHNAVRDLTALVDSESAKEGTTASSLREKYCLAAEQMLSDDERDCRNISEFGSSHIISKKTCGGNIKIATICNTGALACTRYGTALGVIRFLHKKERLERVYPLETRPYNQGSRLTAFECVAENIPATLVVDSAIGYLMQTQKLDACIAGADRVCMNGDTANKIGTYNMAVSAKYHGVPFYIAAPVTTIDQKLADGSGIPVEERSPQEITHNSSGVQCVAEGDNLSVWNPSFDVTPASLITGGIITDVGVITPSADGTIDVAAFLKKHDILKA
eukprot:TRINITY_DN13571_c0_g1_i1.p1 TRINITY_DN13571_c0_g1~~TRINITY_DN13571_c0_g1_i1.p1  ORF type:complete len:370 (+),score=87.98 TRINITY_DN13571_c0_g1_i1:46-1155(+)